MLTRPPHSPDMPRPIGDDPSGDGLARHKTVRWSVAAATAVMPILLVIDVLNNGPSAWNINLHFLAFVTGLGFLAWYRSPRGPISHYTVIVLYFAVLAGIALNTGGPLSTTNFWALAVAAFAALVVGPRGALVCGVGYLAALVLGTLYLPPSPAFSGHELLTSYGVDFFGSLALTTLIARIHDRAHREHRDEIARVNAEIADTRAAAFHNARISSLGEMAAGIAHEVNNPLAIIDGYLQLLHKSITRDGAAKPEIAALADKMRSMVSRITGIVNSLRTFSRHDGGEPARPVALARVVGDLTQLVSEKMRLSRVAYHVDVSPSVYVLAVDGPLGQILMNLVNNAYYVARGVPDGQVTIRASESAEHVIIYVEDNGPGVPPEIVDRLFNPFTTSKPVGDGTGIGLSISRRIAHSYGGDIHYERHDNITRFVVRLPRSDPPKVEMAPTADAAGR